MGILGGFGAGTATPLVAIGSAMPMPNAGEQAASFQPLWYEPVLVDGMWGVQPETVGGARFVSVDSVIGVEAVPVSTVKHGFKQRKVDSAMGIV